LIAHLQLYLHNDFFQEMEIEIPEYGRLPFKERVELRKIFVDQKKKEIKSLYARQIVKVQYNYETILVIKSKIQ